MIHLKLTDSSSNDFYLAESDTEILDGATLQFWYDRIKSISPIRMDLDYDYGGMLRVSGSGTISISPETFEDLARPPLKVTVDARWLNIENQAVTNLFVSTGYLKKITKTEITYSLFTQEIDVDLLDDDTSTYGSGENRVLPLAFGQVDMVEPLRVGTSSDYTYHKAGIQGADASVYKVYEDGRQKNKYTGADYIGTIKDNGDGTFKSVLHDDDTTANEPYGTVRMCGDNDESFSHNSVTYYMNKLDGIFAYCLNRINTAKSTSYTLDSTYARATIPEVAFYQTEQANILDFLSEVSAYFSHCFYIDEENQVFYLIDMLRDNGSEALSSSDGDAVEFFGVEYEYPRPVKKIIAKWTVLDPTTDPDGYPAVDTIFCTQEVDGDNTFGLEKEIKKHYTTVKSDILTAIKNIGDLLQAPTSELKIPYEIGATLGKKYTWTDTALEKPSTINIRARNLIFDPLEYQITIEGQAYAS